MDIDEKLASALDAYGRLVKSLEERIDSLQKENESLRKEVETLKVQQECRDREIERLEKAGKTAVEDILKKVSKSPVQPSIVPAYPNPIGPFVPGSAPDGRNPLLPDGWQPTLPDDIRPGSLPDDIRWPSATPRPWYENPDYRLNSPDGPYVGAGRITCTGDESYALR